MAAKRTAQRRTRLAYGAYFDAALTDLQVELACIAQGGKWEWRGRTCGYGLPYHVKRAIRMLWPKRYWHRWCDLIVDAFLQGPGRTACWGPASSGKSFVFTQCALVMFYARPKGTTVLISSTTREDLQRRIWSYVVELDREARETMPELPGHFIESEMKLLADAQDVDGRSKKDGIIAVACRKGGRWEGLESYIGTKNDVMILVCDEASMMPVGFLDALANLESNDPCYAAIMGNLPNVENPLGWAAEPKVGWDQLPPTLVSRTFETRWVNGRAVQLVGQDSPNLDFPEGQEPYKGLIGRRFIEQQALNYGRDTTKFHMFVSGLVPDQGVNCTIFSRAMCSKHNAGATVVWGHEKLHRGYGLDAAYSGLGGDRTVGFPFVFGKDNVGKWRFQLGAMKIYTGSRDPAKVTHAEQIALDVRAECEQHGIEPANVYFDGTGRSELVSAFARLWSSAVVPVEFGGAASARPAFTGETWRPNERKDRPAGTLKRCNELYANFVSELWFALQHAIVDEKIRGMPEEAVKDGALRTYEIVNGGREQAEPKSEMKERGLRSPDICDAIVVALEGARRMGFPLSAHDNPQKKRSGMRWLEAQRDAMWERSERETLQAA